jgi:hypothetical protein
MDNEGLDFTDAICKAYPEIFYRVYTPTFIDISKCYTASTFNVTKFEDLPSTKNLLILVHNWVSSKFRGKVFILSLKVKYEYDLDDEKHMYHVSFRGAAADNHTFGYYHLDTTRERYLLTPKELFDLMFSKETLKLIEHNFEVKYFYSLYGCMLNDIKEKLKKEVLGDKQ